jgi:hypothetical protein
MDRQRRLITSATLLVIGAVDISRFTAGVRSVAIVGLVGGGLALGVGLSILLSGFWARRLPAGAAERA